MQIELLFLTIIAAVAISISCRKGASIKPLFINELGKDHIPIIRHLFDSNPYFQVVDTEQWLGKSTMKTKWSTF
ncbi:MAG: hypothetical protein IPK57_13020 [Chitinophagaceae bacterium]|nr:hypothetical protein [Chitinophagaceae bacterium]